jgi:3-dehydroquinate dehydratase
LGGLGGVGEMWGGRDLLRAEARMRMRVIMLPMSTYARHTRILLRLHSADMTSIVCPHTAAHMHAHGSLTT